MFRRLFSCETACSASRRSTVHLSRQRDVAGSPRPAGELWRRPNIRIHLARPTVRQRQRANRCEQSGNELEMNRHLRQDQVSLAHRFVMAAVDRNFSGKHGDPDRG